MVMYLYMCDFLVINIRSECNLFKYIEASSVMPLVVPTTVNTITENEKEN